MPFKTLILCFIAACLWHANSFAFGQTGHRVAGAIAEHHLSDEARKQISKILNHQSLAEASTYADQMRSNPAHFWQEVAGAYHYVTVPPGKSYQDVRPPKKGDAVTALAMFKKVLHDPSASLSEKQKALKFTVHIIADLHQPLHAGNGKDHGGNRVKVEFFWQPSNLHRVWDSGLIDRQKLSYTEWTNWLNKSISAKNLIDWASTNPVDWIAESVAIRDTLYPESNVINWDYQYKHLPTLKRRLQQAGVRTAYYLNELFQ